MSLKNWSLPECPYKSLIDGATNQWTISVSGVSVYYYNTLDILTKPLLLSYNNGALTEVANTVEMSAGTWCWCNEDSLSQNTLYIRLPDSSEPDDKVAGSLVCSDNLTVMQGTNGKEVILLSLLLSNNNEDTPAVIAIHHTDLNDVIKFHWKITLEATDSAFALDSKICLNALDKIKIESSLVDVCILINGDES